MRRRVHSYIAFLLLAATFWSTPAPANDHRCQLQSPWSGRYFPEPQDACDWLIGTGDADPFPPEDWTCEPNGLHVISTLGDGHIAEAHCNQICTYKNGSTQNSIPANVSCGHFDCPSNQVFVGPGATQC